MFRFSDYKNGELKMVTDLDFIKEMFEEHQRRNDEQFATLEKYLILKIDSDKCGDCSLSPKVQKLEEQTLRNELWINIMVGAIIVLGFIAPYIIPILFK